MLFNSSMEEVTRKCVHDEIKRKENLSRCRPSVSVWWRFVHNDLELTSHMLHTFLDLSQGSTGKCERSIYSVFNNRLVTQENVLK